MSEWQIGRFACEQCGREWVTVQRVGMVYGDCQLCRQPAPLAEIRCKSVKRWRLVWLWVRVLLFAILFALMTGCVSERVVIVTATPLPPTETPTMTPSATIVASSTPDVTPTREIVNLHAECLREHDDDERRCILNENSGLDPANKTTVYKFPPGRVVTLETPDGYLPTETEPYKDRFMKAEQNGFIGVLEINIDSWSGDVGLGFDLNAGYVGQKYLLRIVSWGVLNGENCSDDMSLNAMVNGVPLASKRISESVGSEYLWLVESARENVLQVRVWVAGLFASCGAGSKVFVDAIQFMPVPDSYDGIAPVV